MVEIFNELNYKKQTCKTCGQEFYSQVDRDTSPFQLVLSVSQIISIVNFLLNIAPGNSPPRRSEEHTSELQSQ